LGKVSGIFPKTGKFKESFPGHRKLPSVIFQGLKNSENLMAELLDTLGVAA
jgi:hypothetical protein